MSNRALPNIVTIFVIAVLIFFANVNNTLLFIPVKQQIDQFIRLIRIDNKSLILTPEGIVPAFLAESICAFAIIFSVIANSKR